MEVVSEIADRVPFFLCHSFGPSAVSRYIIVQDLDKRAHLIGIAEQPVSEKAGMGQGSGYGKGHR
jgi:hypothetical protein